ncbi:MinD/ParA family protein [Anoxynatronum sibiricum]|uniref:MinD/ParA family protein n=1 Tax=Anoxynatronum sibiricum TaxID=210623 RepID=A0ABU9VQK2_9CLOT
MDQAGKLREMIQNRIENKAETLDSAETVPSAQKTRFICVTSGKGGVGKTNFSINLGIALCRLGKRTVVIDADLGLANVDVVAGTVPRYTLNNLLYSDMKLEDILGNGPEGLKIISGGSGMMDLLDLPQEKIQRLIFHFQELYQLFDVAIIDTGAGLSKSILAFSGASDDIIVVTTPEPTSLTDAYAMIKAISNEKLTTRIHIVINRAETTKEGNQYYDKISNASEKFLGKKLEKLGTVLEDVSVSKAVKKQTPLMVEYPGSIAAKNIEVIALRLTNENDAFDHSSMNKGGFVHRLMGIFR